MVSGHSKWCSAIERCCHDNHLRVFAGVWAQPPPPRETHRAVLVVPLARQARHEEGRAEQDHADTPARTGLVAALWHLDVPLAAIAKSLRLETASFSLWLRESQATSPVPFCAMPCDGVLEPCCLGSQARARAAACCSLAAIFLLSSGLAARGGAGAVGRTAVDDAHPSAFARHMVQQAAAGAASGLTPTCQHPRGRVFLGGFVRPALALRGGDAVDDTDIDPALRAAILEAQQEAAEEEADAECEKEQEHGRQGGDGAGGGRRVWRTARGVALADDAQGGLNPPCLHGCRSGELQAETKSQLRGHLPGEHQYVHICRTHTHT